MRRLKPLDGLRTFSVIAVFFSGYHWLLPCGWIGVLVFYVLSGFLITRILLEEREHAPNARGYFGRFYFRRTMRIFPLYFAYLIVLELTHAATGAPEAWSSVRPFSFLYAVNAGMITGAVPPSDAWGHLWTLSVEEQFYIVWPLVVWFVGSRTTLKRAAIALIVLGPIIRAASMALFDWSTGQLYVASTTYLDAFAAGALLAAHEPATTPAATPATPKRVLPLAIGGAAALLAIGVALALATGTAIRTLGYPEGLKIGYGYIWADTPLCLVSALFILAAIRGELEWFGNRTLAYLGKISYGIYLVQRPIKGIYLELLEPKLIALAHSEKLALVIGAVVCLGASVAVAAASYRFFEAPILRWRDRLSAASSR